VTWPIDINADEDLIFQLLHVGEWMRQRSMNATETGPTWAEAVMFCVESCYESITGEAVGDL
jgi:hypothetical protein